MSRGKLIFWAHVGGVGAPRIVTLGRCTADEATNKQEEKVELPTDSGWSGASTGRLAASKRAAAGRDLLDTRRRCGHPFLARRIDYVTRGKEGKPQKRKIPDRVVPHSDELELSEESSRNLPPP